MANVANMGIDSRSATEIPRTGDDLRPSCPSADPGLPGLAIRIPAKHSTTQHSFHANVDIGEGRYRVSPTLAIAVAKTHRAITAYRLLSARTMVGSLSRLIGIDMIEPAYYIKPVGYAACTSVASRAASSRLLARSSP
jgi:hypothetical protein